MIGLAAKRDGEFSIITNREAIGLAQNAPEALYYVHCTERLVKTFSFVECLNAWLERQGGAFEAAYAEYFLPILENERFNYRQITFRKEFVVYQPESIILLALTEYNRELITFSLGKGQPRKAMDNPGLFARLVVCAIKGE